MFQRNPFLTHRRVPVATICDMDESWRDLEHRHERLRWARMRRTPFKRPTDAARSLNIRAGTYRNYELAKADGGRWASLPVVQQIAKKFGVSWVWLESGQGSPDDEPTNPLMAVINQMAERIDEVPPEKRDDAVRAVWGVLDAFSRKAG